ncbi:hypothetical protein B0T16DRAFT_430990 [Cercophora newfieldiana]|uniref:Zn(2)-C6 fungal-type domain-containing protein n=1 Tax=Cercophora newfieldiana TaxID=92897 RepID=A0AA39XVK5_9PEZI|nr:hypothetical protein B0T16DRAFT_430990 [Cercophora newfieldiana]
MQNSYPSPTVDAPDAHYYHIQPREHDMDTDSDRLVQQALASLAEHQEQQSHNHIHDNDHEQDLRELQALQEQEPQHHGQEDQHETHHPVSVDELRLAAQLSQDLAPIMAEAAQDHSQAQGQQQLPPPPDNTHMQEAHDDQVDPDLHQRLQAELQNHDQELQNILPPGNQQAGIPAEHQYHGNGPSPGPHGLPSMPLESYQYQVDNTPPRKRSKVSRACDECRRKKIKCDAQSDALEQPCSNCRRSSAQCLFSRVPQKRGPSKGYIKELADRINTIEGKLGGSVVESILEGAIRRTPTETFPSPQPADESRKRQFSSISGDSFPTPTSASGRGPPWPTEHRAIRPFIPQDRSLTYAANDLAPKPTVLPAIPNDSLPPRAEPSILDGISDGLSQDPLQQPERVREIDDQVFNCYLAAIHPTFPILARTKARVQSLISQCPPSLQDAFCDAFLDFTRPFLQLPGLIIGETIASAHRSLLDWELEQHPRTPATDLVYFQTTVMMALDQDRGRARAFPQAALIGKAAGIGLSQKLHLASPDPVPSLEFDPDSDHNVALRAWWALVSFDRWHAIATGVPVSISNDTAVVLPGLRYIVGDGAYQLIQLSHVIGSFVMLAQTKEADVDHRGARIMSSLALSVIEQQRLQFPAALEEAHFQHIYLAYWHTRLLADMFSPKTRMDNIMHDCENLIRLMANPPQPPGPLYDHFRILLSLILIELTKISETRDSATKMIKDMLECGIVSSPRNAALRDKIADTLPTQTQGREATMNDTSVKNLQQLADVATAAGPTTALEVSLPAPSASNEAAIGDVGGPAPVSVAAPPLMTRTGQEKQSGGDQKGFETLQTFLRVGYLTFSERGSMAG